MVKNITIKRPCKELECMSAFPVSSFFSLNDFFVLCKNIIFKFLTPFCAFVYLAAAGAAETAIFTAISNAIFI
jgi:hypothetical protein